MDYTDRVKEHWEKLTGEPAPSFRLLDTTVAALLQEHESESAVLKYILTSISAWVWACHGKQQQPPLNLNNTLLSERNVARVHAFIEHGFGHQFNQDEISRSVLLNEQDWLTFLALGEVPDYEIFTPCVRWVVISQLWGRRIPDPSPLFKRVDRNEELFGRVLVSELAKAQSKTGCEALLLSVQDSIANALELTLTQRGMMIRTEVDGGIEAVRYTDDRIPALVKENNLRKRDNLWLKLHNLVPSSVFGINQPEFVPDVDSAPKLAYTPALLRKIQLHELT